MKVPLAGPKFGAYAADEVSWLLIDLSEMVMEAAAAERETAIQAGRAHYAESLPIEYQPDSAYRSLFSEVLCDSAIRVAIAVGVVTELVLAERGQDITLVSLACAGTPIGILMRRWAEVHHNLKLPHYAISIVRDRGIDTAALNYVGAQHNPASVVFVDGWTGKGAITRELAEALRQHAADTGTHFNPDPTPNCWPASRSIGTCWPPPTTTWARGGLSQRKPKHSDRQRRCGHCAQGGPRRRRRGLAWPRQVQHRRFAH
jgi:phosphoribosyl transferase-like protein